MHIEMNNCETRPIVGEERRWCRAYLPFLFFLLAIESQFIVNQAQAQYFTGAVARGMGGAGRASAEPSEAVMLNPATIVHGPEFSNSGILRRRSVGFI